MTITVDIGPEVQAELTRRAEADGSVVEVYAATLLQKAVQLPASPPRLSDDRIENILGEMAQFSHKIPALPDSAFTREFIYPYDGQDGD